MLPPECETALAELDAYRRGELPAAALESVQRHLDECRRCSAYKQHEDVILERLIGAARNCSCPEKLRATIQQMVARESRGN